ncbi:hypothetical protein K431DRAFT_283869 [Polychaeton citri CBS 116435]|uniref:EamA domain-containing protein n=1 Tax=Polychaeton citri CBS 116435 TaxID=1314669 RepID=A0A9P4QCN5_9PEZI|nr:hypothetical protein K431DRAFT_283869 [Polychaeton citri CBS 116435]
MSNDEEKKTANVHTYIDLSEDGVDSNLDFAPQDESKSRFYTTSSNGFLAAPLSGPVRPVSPDAISQLSADEYEQLQPARPASHFNIDSQGHQSVPTYQNGWKGRIQASWNHNRGLAYMLLAQLFGTSMNVTVRFLEVEGNHGKGMHPYQILSARMGITFIIATGYMWWKKTPHFPLGMKEVRWLLVARGFGGFFGVFGMYYSLLYLPLADATVITFLAPSLACWACSILINEPFTRREQMAALVSLVGVFLIARPTALFGSSSPGDIPPASGNLDATPSINGTSPTTGGSSPDASNYESVTSSQRLSAVGIALLGVLGAATAFTSIRWMGRRTHPLLSVNYFAGWCFIVSFAMQATLPDIGFVLPADFKEWLYLLFLGACGFVMQFLLAAGLSYEKSSRATNMIYSQMIFALASDKIFFGHTPGWMSIIGSSLIIGSAIVVTMQQATGQRDVRKEPTGGSVGDEMHMAAGEGVRGGFGGAGRGVGDEESRVGLMAAVEDDDTSEDHERDRSLLPYGGDAVHMRELR